MTAPLALEATPAGGERAQVSGSTHAHDKEHSMSNPKMIQARHVTVGMKLNIGTVERPELGVVVQADSSGGNPRAKTMTIVFEESTATPYGLSIMRPKSDELKLWDNEARLAAHFIASERPAATGQGSVVCDNSRTWVAVRQTPAFAVALDIARQERRTQTRLDVARAAVTACDDRDSEAADAFIATLRTARNDNNVLWGAARLLAALVDNDDELGALQVLRDELDRQDAGKPEDPYDRWNRAQTR